MLALLLMTAPFELTLHLETDNPALRLVPDERAGDPICTGSCVRTLTVVPDESFHFEGDGVSDSGSFQLAPRDALGLRVHAGNAQLRTAGRVLAAASVLPLLVAYGLAGANAACAAEPQPCGVPQSTVTGVAAVGLATGLLGLILVLANRTTWEEFHVAPAAGFEAAPR